jgi:hypothetical protein
MKTFHGMILYLISGRFFNNIRLLKEIVDFQRIEASTDLTKSFTKYITIIKFITSVWSNAYIYVSVS